MKTAIWALAPIAECIIEASCDHNLRAGMYGCDGCIGNGQRILVNNMRKAEVIIDESEKIHIVSIL
jgi:hypothetical protein